MDEFTNTMNAAIKIIEKYANLCDNDGAALADCLNVMASISYYVHYADKFDFSSLPPAK